MDCHLEVAKWLFSINNEINVNQNNDEAFIFVVVKNGHLEVVKWLLNLNHISKYNIPLDNHYSDEILKLLYQYGYYDQIKNINFQTRQTEIVRTLNFDTATENDLTLDNFFIAKYMINFGYHNHIFDK